MWSRPATRLSHISYKVKFFLFFCRICWIISKIYDLQIDKVFNNMVLFLFDNLELS